MAGRKLKAGRSEVCGLLRIGAFWLTALMLSLPAVAENISVDPVEWDFGDVLVGETASKSIALTSLGPTPLTIYELEIDDNPSGVFSIDSLGVARLPVSIPADEFFDVLVSFTPVDLGLYTAAFTVISNATPPTNDIDVALRGVGVTDASGIPMPAVAWLLGTGLLGWRVSRCLPR